MGKMKSNEEYFKIGYKYLFYNSESKKLDQIKRLKDYYIENNNIPTHKTNKELGSIYYNLRDEYKNNKIQQVYVDKLKDLKIFEMVIGDKRLLRINNIIKIKDFYEQNNKLPTRKTNPKLRNIFFTLKTEYKNNKMKQVYVDKLIELDMIGLINGDKK